MFEVRHTVYELVLHSIKSKRPQSLFVALQPMILKKQSQEVVYISWFIILKSGSYKFCSVPKLKKLKRNLRTNLHQSSSYFLLQYMNGSMILLFTAYISSEYRKNKLFAVTTTVDLKHYE